MEVDKTFSSLEHSFLKIESKVLDKRQSIENCYQKNVDEIEEKFKNENLEFHTDALNQSREKMLKQIYDDRNGLLETVNSSWETIREGTVDRVDAQNELNRVSRELKDKYSSLCLNKARFLDFRIGSLFKFKFKRPAIELHELNKYRMFVATERKFDLNLHDNQTFNYDFDYVNYYYLKVLNKYLVILLMEDKKAPSSEIFLISEDGKVVLSKRFTKYWVYSAGVSNSYIFLSCRDFNSKKKFNIHMYDFKLNLLKSFSLSKRYSTKFIVGTKYNGLAFTNDNLEDTLFFNTNNFTFIPFRKWLENEYALFNKSYKLIHFNESYLYLLNTKISKLRIYHRTGRRLNSIRFDDDDVSENMFQFDNDGQIYFNVWDFIEIYNSNGGFIAITSIEETIYSFYFNQKESFECYDYDLWQKNLMDFLSTNV